MIEIIITSMKSCIWIEKYAQFPYIDLSKKAFMLFIWKRLLTLHYELPLSKIIKFQLWWKPMVYVLIRAYLSNLSWKKCSKKIFVIGKNWKSDQKISGLLSKYFINWS